jgi:glycine betaine/proline transport system substrate-binding protein
VETSYADVAVIFSSIAQGDYDLYTDMWLPVTHKTYLDEYGENLVKISTTFEGARIGLVVPSYVSIDSIPELNEHKDKFDEQIVGIDTGAGIMKTTNKAIEEYGLDLSLKASSGPVMTATLKDAIDKEEWVVVTGWKPHWKFARWDLKFLEDPKKLYGAVENTWAVGRTGFREDFPEVTAFLENFTLTDSQLGGVMGLIADSEKEAYQVAKEWVHDHPDLVEEWTP